MFRYGKRAGYMAIVLLALAAVPLVVAAFVVPGLPETVPVGIAGFGEGAGEGSRFEMLLVPALCLLVGVLTFLTAWRRASAVDDSTAMARLTAERFLRSGILTAAILAGLSLYLLFTAMASAAGA